MAEVAISSLVSIPTLVALLAVIVLYLIYRVNSGADRALRHPPGPRELPFIGSIFTLLFTKLTQHELLFKWSGQYGGIFSFTLAGGRVVVLSDMELIQETLQDPYVNDRIPFPACTTIFTLQIPDTTFDDTNMLQTCWDAMFPGYETTISAFRWALHLLAAHPETQSRIHQEIIDAVGRDQLPAYADRHRLPLMEATVTECLRLRPVIPYVAPHIVSRDRKIAGYDVAVGTRVTINLWFLARSPTLWEEPDEFRPERFLDEAGCYDRSREPIPFSYGRRTCPGDQLARMELFLILSYVLQRFTLSLPDGSPGKLDGSMGATYRPNQYELRATRLTTNC